MYYVSCSNGDNCPYENEKWAAHGPPTVKRLTVGSLVDMRCLFMLTHYNICRWASHGQLSGQKLPINFQTRY